MRDRWDEHIERTHVNCDWCGDRINLDLQDMREVKVKPATPTRLWFEELWVCESCEYDILENPNVVTEEDE